MSNKIKKLSSTDGGVNFHYPDEKYLKINYCEEYVIVMINLQWIRFEKCQLNGTESDKEVEDLRLRIKV